MLRTWLLAFSITMLFILVKGYTFNSGDQEEHLPQVYQMINPKLYPKDYFLTAYHQTFTVRFFFVWLIYLFHFIMPVSLACFLLHLLCVTISAWSIQKIALHFKASELFAAGAAFFALVIFNSFTIGGNALSDTQLTSGSFAATFCSLAFYYITKEKWLLAAIVTGLASLFQVLAGLQIMCIIAILFLLSESKPRRIVTLMKIFLAYLIVAAPMLFPILYLQTQLHSNEQSDLFYDILYRVRNPNHYLPSAFPLRDYIRYLSLLTVAGLLHFFIDERLKKIWLTLFIVITAGMALYTFLLEGINFMPVGKLQWFKLSAWMMMISIVAVMVFLSKAFDDKLKKPYRFKISLFGLVAFIIAAMIIITNSRFIPVKRLHTRYHIGNYPLTDLNRMHQWIKTNTPDDCVILSAPDDPSFLCEAQRSMPIGWKAIIHEPFFLIPWYQKFKMAYHSNAPFNRLNVLKQATDHYFKYPPLPTTKLNWDYRLTNLEHGSIIPSKETVIHREGAIVLLKLFTK